MLDELKEYSSNLKEREKKSFKLKDTGMTEEEMIKSQEALFAGNQLLNG